MKAQWEEVTSREGVPGARSSHAIAAVGSKVYLFGGELQPRVPIDSTLYAFNLDTRAWAVVPATGDVPSPRIGVTMVAVGPTLYVFGGRDAEHTELSEFFSFDTITGEWALLSSGDASPPARSYHAMAVDADSSAVFVFGGCGSNGRLNDLWCYTEASRKWAALPSPPAGSTCVPRGGPGLVAASGSIWVIFGFCGHELRDVHRYNLASQTWQQVTLPSDNSTWPLARSVLGAVALGTDSKKVAVFGGEVDPSDLGHAGAGQFSDEVFVFDTEATSWHKVQVEGTGPGPRGWFPAASVERGMLIYGGNSDSNDRLDDMFVLRFTSP